MIRRRVMILLVLCLAAAGSAAAQTTEPLGLFAADVRVALPGYKQFPAVATALGVDTLDLPKRGRGLVIGGHFYPARRGVVTLGIGAELMTSSRGQTQAAAKGSTTPGETVQTHFSSFSPQISLNFGAKNGWSYLSGGLGWGAFTTELESKPLPDADSRIKTINYGGGARWFVNQHVALSLDLRFYAVNPQLATAVRPGFSRMTIVAFSAGVGLR